MGKILINLILREKILLNGKRKKEKEYYSQSKNLNDKCGRWVFRNRREDDKFIQIDVNRKFIEK